MMRPLVLLIDSTFPDLHACEAVLRGDGHDVRIASDGTTGLLRLRTEQPAVVFLDLHLPDRNGLGLLAEILALRPGVPVVVTSSDDRIETSVAAMRCGAFDFLVKPIDEQRLLSAVGQALAQAASDKARGDAQAEPSVELIGSSSQMQQVYDRIRSVARSGATVFITGESGTGKELCALAVHGQSSRADGPFVPVNCGAIPPEMLESEVFGHLQGSFIGAISDKTGAAAAADGGTLFLDEICELDLSLQAKLMPFLQSSTIQPVGAARSRKVDVRIICATNRDPQEAVRAGQLREDLFYRLHVVPIHMPPLRSRGEDIIDIAEHALRRYGAEEGRGFTKLSPEVKEILRAQTWPGNVRQLLNVIRHVVVLNDGDLVLREMLPEDVRSAPASPSDRSDAAAPGLDQTLAALMGRPLAEVERLVIEHALNENNGSVPRVARMLDVAPSTLYRKIDAWRRDVTALQ